MKSKFTPGPWDYNAEPSCDVFEITDCEGAVVAETNWSTFEPTVYKKHQEANARLIAAAPEMYAALEKAIKQIEELPECDRSPYYFFYKPAKAVIKKVEGNNLKH